MRSIVLVLSAAVLVLVLESVSRNRTISRDGLASDCGSLDYICSNRVLAHCGRFVLRSGALLLTREKWSVSVVGSCLVLGPVLVLGTPDTTLLGRVAGEGNEPAGRVHRVIG